MEERFIQNPKTASRLKQLTPRQREIVQLLAESRSAKEIASILDISISTVHFHKYGIMEELGLAPNAQLVQYAIKHLLMPPPQVELGRRITLNTGVDTVNCDSSQTEIVETRITR